MAPRILNFAEWSAAIMARVSRQAAVSGDAELLQLYDELSRYPGVSTERHIDGSEPVLMHRLRLAD
jgi:hypothetical protein